jgi:hypothetical protein
MKRKYISILVLLELAFVGVVYADDVSLSSGTIINAGGIDMVLGASADLSSLVVNADDFSFTIGAGQTVVITSADRRSITIPSSGTGGTSTSATCESSQSTYTITNPSSGSAATVTVTPGSATCDSSSSTTSTPLGGGPSGYSGGSPYTPAAVVPVTPPTSPSFVPPAVVPPAYVYQPLTASYVFNKPLSQGTRHQDIKRLQQLLNSDDDTKVSLSGPGSLGQETDYFGPATVKAIGKFQKKYGIAKPGQIGYGTFGPNTRAKLNALFGQQQSGTLPSQASDRAAQIKLLQQQLSVLIEQLAKLKKGN